MCRFFYLLTTFFISRRNLRKNAMPLLGWKISASVKWLGCGSQKHIQWPAASQTHILNGIHINLVNIWSLLSVNFYANKQIVHNFRQRLIFKAFSFHHMAPMASRIANTHDHGLVFRFRFFQSFFAPRKPIDRVVGMLQ